MAVRLSVVMVHSPPASAAASQLAEAIVGELIGLREIDLTLVGPLANLPAESTDRLSLDSLTGDVAVLDWQAPENIVASLGTLGFEGNRSPHAHDDQAPQIAPSQRRIYAFDLTRFSDVAQLREAITGLRSTRQVRTFGLSLPSTKAGGSLAQPNEAQPHEAQPNEAQPHEAQPHEAQPLEAQPREAKSGEAKSGGPGNSPMTDAGSQSTGSRSSPSRGPSPGDSGSPIPSKTPAKTGGEATEAMPPTAMPDALDLDDLLDRLDAIDP